MEKMLKEADITPANLSKLSAGFQKLGTTVDKMGEISDVVKATGDYTAKTNEATAALTTVKDAYSKFANSMNAFSNCFRKHKRISRPGTGSYQKPVFFKYHLPAGTAGKQQPPESTEWFLR